MGAPTARLETVVVISPLKTNALIFSILACVMFLIALLTDNWLTASDYKQGLRRECTLMPSNRTAYHTSLSLTGPSSSSLSASNNANQISSDITLNNFKNLYNTIHNSTSDLQTSANKLYLILTSHHFRCKPLKDSLSVHICGSLVVVCTCCSILGIVLISMGFAHKERQERKQRLYGAATFVYIVGVICILVALIIYPLMLVEEIRTRHREKWYFGWSYGVAWGGAIFIIGAAILLICDRNKEEIFYREKLVMNDDDEANNDS